MGNQLGGDATRQLQPKQWIVGEIGVLPIFLYNQPNEIGETISLHFFEPRYVRLLETCVEPPGEEEEKSGGNAPRVITLQQLIQHVREQQEEAEIKDDPDYEDPEAGEPETGWNPEDNGLSEGQPQAEEDPQRRPRKRKREEDNDQPTPSRSRRSSPEAELENASAPPTAAPRGAAVDEDEKTNTPSNGAEEKTSTSHNEPDSTMDGDSNLNPEAPEFVPGSASTPDFPNGFIYCASRNPQAGGEALICGVQQCVRHDVHGVLQHRVIIQQAWQDEVDGLWWCRFRVTDSHQIRPIMHKLCSPNFGNNPQGLSRYGSPSRQPSRFNLTWRNLGRVENSAPTCPLHWTTNFNGDVGSFICVCHEGVKAQLLEDCSNKQDPEHFSLKELPSAIDWLVHPKPEDKYMRARDLLPRYHAIMAEAVGDDAFKDFGLEQITLYNKNYTLNLRQKSLEMLRELDLVSLQGLTIDGKVSLARQGPAGRRKWTAQIDFGITVCEIPVASATSDFDDFDGLASFGAVGITLASAQTALHRVSWLVNRLRVELLLLGNKNIAGNASPLKRLPADLVKTIEKFIVFNK